MRRRVLDSFTEFSKLTGKLTSSQRTSTETITDPGEFADAVAALVITDPTDRQKLLEENHAQERLMMLATMLYRELDVLRLDQQITQKLHEEIEKNQKEHIFARKFALLKKNR